MHRRTLLGLMLTWPLVAACEPQSNEMTTSSQQAATIPHLPEGCEIATLGAGCYWCAEAAYQQMEGVISVTSGFMGGKTQDPTYEEVCRGDSGHAEMVQVVFDPEKTSYRRVLDWFWQLHDPTTLNRQGNDVGTQYRSVIFYQNEDQREIAVESMAEAAAQFADPIVTELAAASEFYPAQVSHQDYYFQNKSKNPYCKFVIEPKLKKLNLKH